MLDRLAVSLLTRRIDRALGSHSGQAPPPANPRRTQAAAASPRLGPQLVIPAAEVDEGAAVGVFGVEDLGDQDGVVAGVDHAMDAALEPGKRAVD